MALRSISSLVLLAAYGLWASPSAARCTAPAVAWSDLLQQPAGKAGLVPNPRWLQTPPVRLCITGFVAQTPEPTPGHWLLSPVPVSLGDAQEAEADDLPAHHIRVTGIAIQTLAADAQGRVTVEGQLRWQRDDSAPGRVSWLHLDAAPPSSPPSSPTPAGE